MIISISDLEQSHLYEHILKVSDFEVIVVWICIVDPAELSVAVSINKILRTAVYEIEIESLHTRFTLESFWARVCLVLCLVCARDRDLRDLCEPVSAECIIESLKGCIECLALSIILSRVVTEYRELVL